MNKLFGWLRSIVEGLIGLAVVGSGSLVLVFNALLLAEGYSHSKIIFSMVMGALLFLVGWVILIRLKKGVFLLYLISGLFLLLPAIIIVVGGQILIGGVIMPALWNTTSSGQFMILGMLFISIVLGVFICLFRAYWLWRQRKVLGGIERDGITK